MTMRSALMLGPGRAPSCLASCRRRRRHVAAAAAPPPGARSSQQQTVAPSTTFEDAGEWLAERAVSLAERAESGRAIVGITGPPGGGKSTLAAFVRRRADELLRQREQRQPTQQEEEAPNDLAVVLPMDGFHYTRAQLDAFPDPAAAHARRGAPWTFDAAAFVEAVARARRQRGPGGGSDNNSNPASATTLLVPSFDHAVKDPVPDQIRISPSARIVIVEGNYLLLEEEPWARLWRRRHGGGGGGGDGSNDGEGSPLLDETWFVDAPLEAAMAHIFARQTGDVGLSAEESRRRVEQNDAPNARLVASCRGRADVLVPGELPMHGQAGGGG